MSRAPLCGVRCHRDLFISYGSDGIRVFNLEPLSQLLHIATNELGEKYTSPVYCADILRRTNILAFTTKAQESIVKIWNIERRCVVREIEFHQSVGTFKFHHDNSLIIVLYDEIHVMKIVPEVEKLAVFETRANILGVMTTNSSTVNSYLAFPASSKDGHVELVDLKARAANSSKPRISFSAHEHSLAMLSFNNDGSKLASASTHGTIVRVFDTLRRIQLAEFRRGSDTALIYSLNFSSDTSYLCAASDKGTVHIFGISDRSINKKTLLSHIPLNNDYIDSVWSNVKMSVPAEMACSCAFVPEQRQTLVVLCIDGTYRKYSFTTSGGSQTQTGFDRFLELGDMMEM